MAVSFNKIITLKKKDPIIIQINNTDITVKQYLSIKDKADFVGYVSQNTFDEKGFYSPLRYQIYFTIGLIKFYTNINITDAMIKNIEQTYDYIILNKIDQIIISAIDKEEIESVLNFIEEAIQATQEYIQSFAGQLQAAHTNYEALNFDLEGIEKTLQDPEQIGFLKDVMEKMG